MTDRVRLRVRGRFPERFIERALSQGAVFEEVERIGAREIRVEASSPDARLVAALAEELGLEATCESREGWRAALEAALRRGTLLLGVALGLALVALFAGRVWLIDIAALDRALPPAEEAALAVRLRELGVCPGVSRSAVEPSLLSAQLLSEFERLTYAGVRLRGVRLTVEYQTENAAPPVYRAEEARSLLAARDAVIVRVTPLAGKACVRPGDTVKAGQLLISGEERTGAETTRAVRALGEVIGRVWFVARVGAPLTGTVRERTGRVRRASALRLFDWRWPLAEAADFAAQDVETELLPVGGLYLPAFIERRALYEVSEREAPADRAALESRLTREALSAARARMPADALETARWTDVAQADGVLTVEAVIEATMDIAVGDGAFGTLKGED